VLYALQTSSRPPPDLQTSLSPSPDLAVAFSRPCCRLLQTSLLPLQSPPPPPDLAPLPPACRDSLPPTRLYCGRCRSLREISEFPFRLDGYRKQNCLFCQYQQREARHQRKARQQGCEAQRSGEREEFEDTEEHTEEYGGSESRYCSACYQRRTASLFGRFRTCELCRSTNKKSLSRKRKREKEEKEEEKENLAPTEAREGHLHTWVKLRGEEAVKTATKYVDNVAPPTLTMADYTKEGSLTSSNVRNKRQRRQELAQEVQGGSTTAFAAAADKSVVSSKA
jgi:hypothetical protein